MIKTLHDKDTTRDIVEDSRPNSAHSSSPSGSQPQTLPEIQHPSGTSLSTPERYNPTMFNQHHPASTQHSSHPYPNTNNHANGHSSHPPMYAPRESTYSYHREDEYRASSDYNGQPQRYSSDYNHPPPNTHNSQANYVSQPQTAISGDHVPFTYTSDAATKLSDLIRRRCFNCCTSDTSTWRRSNLNPGKVLCNKCGLFERTHSRARPDQFPHRRSGPESQTNVTRNGDGLEMSMNIPSRITSPRTGGTSSPRMAGMPSPRISALSSPRLSGMSTPRISGISPRMSAVPYPPQQQYDDAPQNMNIHRRPQRPRANTFPNIHAHMYSSDPQMDADDELVRKLQMYDTQGGRPRSNTTTLRRTAMLPNVAGMDSELKEEHHVKPEQEAIRT